MMKCGCKIDSTQKAMQAQKGIPVTRIRVQARLIYQIILIITVFITVATVAVHLFDSVLLCSNSSILYQIKINLSSKCAFIYTLFMCLIFQIKQNQLGGIENARDV